MLCKTRKSLECQWFNNANCGVVNKRWIAVGHRKVGIALDDGDNQAVRGVGCAVMTERVDKWVLDGKTNMRY